MDARHRRARRSRRRARGRRRARRPVHRNAARPRRTRRAARRPPHEPRHRDPHDGHLRAQDPRRLRPAGGVPRPAHPPHGALPAEPAAPGRTRERARRVPRRRHGRPLRVRGSGCRGRRRSRRARHPLPAPRGVGRVPARRTRRTQRASTARFIVGADGARSAVAKDLGLDRNRHLLIGAEEVFAVPPLRAGQEPTFHCVLDPSIAPGYLAWSVNDGEHAHVGVAGYAHRYPDGMRNALARFAAAPPGLEGIERPPSDRSSAAPARSRSADCCAASATATGCSSATRPARCRRSRRAGSTRACGSRGRRRRCSIVRCAAGMPMCCVVRRRFAARAVPRAALAAARVVTRAHALGCAGRVQRAADSDGEGGGARHPVCGSVVSRGSGGDVSAIIGFGAALIDPHRGAVG